MNWQALIHQFARKFHVHRDLVSKDELSGSLAAAAQHNHDQSYYTEAELDAGQLDNRYYTEAELDAGQLDNRYYTEAELDAGQLDNRYYTEGETDALLAGINQVLPLPMFKVNISAPQSILANTWTTIDWASYYWNFNSPAFDLVNNWHKPAVAGVFGIWHYSILVTIVPSATQVAIRVMRDGTEIAFAEGAPNRAHLSMIDKIGSGEEIVTQIFCSANVDLIEPSQYTHWAGVRLGSHT